MKKIDLHVHTNISDGSESPKNTVIYAKRMGLYAIAVTDHDTVSGIPEAQAAGKALGVEVVAGLELGCGWGGREVHMLGYDIDPSNEELCKALQFLVADRDERNRKMAAKMNADGMHVDIDELHERYPDSVIGRPHMAMCLIEEGLAVSVQDAFHRYLDPGKKYYIRRHFLTLSEAATLIRGAGGKAVIAHPGQYRLDDEGLIRLMDDAANAQVSGLEPGEFVHVIADCHIYDRHLPIVEEIIKREPFPAPTVTLDKSITDFYEFTPDSFKVENYLHGEKIGKFPVAV